MPASTVRIKYTCTEEPLLFEVLGTVDGKQALVTRFRARNEKHLRGMLAHDLMHVLAGIGFSRANEAELKQYKLLGVKEIDRVERATAKLLKGKNIILQ